MPYKMKIIKIKSAKPAKKLPKVQIKNPVIFFNKEYNPTYNNQNINIIQKQTTNNVLAKLLDIIESNFFHLSIF